VEQGHPTVAFNPNAQEYLVAWHISGPALQGGAHVVIGQRLFGHSTTRKTNPFLLAKAKFPTGFRPVREPKLMYNSGSGKLGRMFCLLSRALMTSFPEYHHSQTERFR
jgi:hypothetical protein